MQHSNWHRLSSPIFENHVRCWAIPISSKTQENQSDNGSIGITYKTPTVSLKFLKFCSDDTTKSWGKHPLSALPPLLLPPPFLFWLYRLRGLRQESSCFSHHYIRSGLLLASGKASRDPLYDFRGLIHRRPAFRLTLNLERQGGQQNVFSLTF